MMKTNNPKRGYKLTEIGEIPEEWEVVKLGQVSKIRYGLGQPPELDSTGIPMIRATDFKRGRFISDSVIRVKLEGIPRGKNPFLKKSDIIVVRSGVYTGDILMYDGRWKIAVAGYDLVVSPSDTIDSVFITEYLLSKSSQSYFRSQSTRSAQPHLNSKQLSNTIVPQPSLPEQQKIAKILSKMNEKIEMELKRKQRLQELKKGLMQVLLTGKVMVKV